MPQLLPFYFVNQIAFLFLTLVLLHFIFSKYVLPFFSTQQSIRVFITQLFNTKNNS